MVKLKFDVRQRTEEYQVTSNPSFGTNTNLFLYMYRDVTNGFNFWNWQGISSMEVVSGNRLIWVMIRINRDYFLNIIHNNEMNKNIIFADRWLQLRILMFVNVFEKCHFTHFSFINPVTNKISFFEIIHNHLAAHL